MKVLPARTELPDQPISRTHAPELTDYARYRDCARWDFGFTCAMCFLHESDLIEGGAEGTGLVWIEHHELKSTVPDKRDDYGNCLLSCRFCNNGRSIMLTVEPNTGASLLDPTCVSWRSRFVVDGCDMKVRDDDDRDARYTWTAYRLGSARKSALREQRERRMQCFRIAEDDMATLVPELLQQAAGEADPKKAELLLEAARAVEAAYNRALAEILPRYAAVPSDRPSRCRCTLQGDLPGWLTAQLVEVQESGVA
jgi:hypothetical protein